MAQDPGGKPDSKLPANKKAVNHNLDIRDFMRHLEHVMSGVWADRRWCRVCGLHGFVNHRRIPPQWEA